MINSSKQKWHEFLHNYGAELNTNGLITFCQTQSKDINLEEKTYLLELGHQGSLIISGADTDKFLQGQVTCNIAHVNTHISLPGAHCTPKGRMLTSFRAIRDTDNAIVLKMHHSILNATYTTLKKYSVFFNVKLETDSKERRFFGVAGKNAEHLLLETFGQVPQRPNDCIITPSNIAVIKIAPSRYECWIPEAQACTTWGLLASHCHLAGPDAGDLLDIRDGHGHIQSNTQEMFIPQMINLDKIGGISFKKGCYTGQEIVARMHYLGKSKRRLFRGILKTSKTELTEPPLAGDTVYNHDGRNAGNILTATLSVQGIELLFVCSDDAANNDSLFLTDDRSNNPSAHPLTVFTLSYSDYQIPD